MDFRDRRDRRRDLDNQPADDGVSGTDSREVIAPSELDEELFRCIRLARSRRVLKPRSESKADVLPCSVAFELESNYKPRGDQGQAIAKLLKSIEAGNRHQTLLGVTGSGKTFTMANVIRELERPTLVISHNKTLAAQLYSEFKQFFPQNAVEYFVSYFDYYQPEAYIPRTDTYIEKDSSINEEIER